MTSFMITFGMLSRVYIAVRIAGIRHGQWAFEHKHFAMTSSMAKKGPYCGPRAVLHCISIFEKEAVFPITSDEHNTKKMQNSGSRAQTPIRWLIVGL